MNNKTKIEIAQSFAPLHKAGIVRVADTDQGWLDLYSRIESGEFGKVQDFVDEGWEGSDGGDTKAAEIKAEHSRNGEKILFTW